jgi:His-Xaa-Ser system protein HxsD
MSHAGSVTLRFDPSVFRLTAIKKAAYRFSDRCYLTITILNNDEIEVAVRGKSADPDVTRIAAEFGNEVLDQELREVVREETVGIRNLLLAQAFSATSLVDRVGENSDVQSDPLRIARPDCDRS